MQHLLNLIHAHWLYVVVGLLYLGLHLVLTKHSQIDAWCEKRPRVAGIMKLVRGLGIDPWLIAQGLTLLFKGRLPVGYVSLADKILKMLAAGALVLLATGCGATVEVTAATAADGTKYPYCIQVTQPLNPLATRVKVLGCATAEAEAQEQREAYERMYPSPRYKLAIVRGVK